MCEDRQTEVHASDAFVLFMRTELSPLARLIWSAGPCFLEGRWMRLSFVFLLVFSTGLHAFVLLRPVRLTL